MSTHSESAGRKFVSKEETHTQKKIPAQHTDHTSAENNTTPQKPVKDDRRLREERILDAAATLLVRWGYRKTTIDDVAREAGVGKGTIYLHWKDKNELFLAAIWRASKQLSDEVIQKIESDPEGGHFYRLWAHGMTAILTNPLMAAFMRGGTDIFQGMMGALDPATINHLIGNAEDHIKQLQDAGEIRTDLSVPVITMLMGSMKMGLICASDFMPQIQTPSIEELTDAISDMMHRWLSPEHLPSDSTSGKHIVTEWLQQATEIGEQYQFREREEPS